MHPNIPFFIYKWLFTTLIIILIIYLFFDFNWYTAIYLILLLIALAVYYSFKVYNKKKVAQIRNARQKKIENFKLKSTIIPVDLTQFKIKSNSWVDTVITDNSKYAGLNQLTGNSEKNFTKINRQIHNVVIPIKINNEEFSYIFESSRDLNSLKIDLLEKKSTNLYINPNDESDYYLDMEFLYDH